MSYTRTINKLCVCSLSVFLISFLIIMLISDINALIMSILIIFIIDFLLVIGILIVINCAGIRDGDMKRRIQPRFGAQILSVYFILIISQLIQIILSIIIYIISEFEPTLYITTLNLVVSLIGMMVSSK